jgi:hypothetical protein
MTSHTTRILRERSARQTARLTLATLPLAELARLSHTYERTPGGGPAAAAIDDLIRAVAVARAAVRDLLDRPPTTEAAA